MFLNYLIKKMIVYEPTSNCTEFVLKIWSTDEIWPLRKWPNICKRFMNIIALISFRISLVVDTWAWFSLLLSIVFRKGNFPFISSISINSKEKHVQLLDFICPHNDILCVSMIIKFHPRRGNQWKVQRIKDGKISLWNYRESEIFSIEYINLLEWNVPYVICLKWKNYFSINFLHRPFETIALNNVA